MTVSYTIEVDGFEFGITSGSGPLGIDGVSIPAGSAHLDNPAYVKALQKALDAQPYYYAMDYLDEFLVRQAHGNRLGMYDGMLDECAKYAALIRSPECPIEISEEMTEALVWLDRKMEIRREKEELARRRAEPKPGFVYILKAFNSDLRKIGRTTDPANRLHTFEVKLPFHVSYELVIKSPDAKKLERDLHQRFASARTDGEWFLLSDSDINDLRQQFAGSLWNV